MPNPNEKTEDQKVNRRNIIIVRISSSDKILVGSEQMDITLLKDKVKEFLANPNNDPSMPDKEMKLIEGWGKTVPVSKGVISLQNDRGTSYKAYIAVQNELVKAVNELRNEFSMANFGKTYARLDEEQQGWVKKAVPQIISEAEPMDVKGSR